MKTPLKMLVIKRDNSLQEFSRSEVLKDVEKFLTKNIDTDSLLSELEKGLVDKITTRQISDLLANICASRISKHPDYNKLASAICVVKLHKETSTSYRETVERLYNNEPKLVSQELYGVVMKNREVLDSVIDYSRDFLFDFFGLKTLERSYLKKIHSKSLETTIFEAEEGSKVPVRKDALGHNNEELKYVHTSTIVERPQHLYMTVSLGIHGEDIEKAIESYNYMSNLMFTMATPTMYNSGTPRQQMSSCYILDMQDNIENIFKVIGDCGMLSKYSGGIGLCLSRIRSKKSTIRGTNGQASGIIPLCRVLNDVARYIDQGSKRNGSIAVYVEPWTDCIYSFLDMKKNTGDENLRCRDLFMGLWVPDLFMKRVQNDEIWSLMCPDECKGLVDSYGEEFEALYTKYEKEGKYRRQVKAKDLWMHILEAQLETGVPYLCFKDHVNRKTNHQNVGVIKSSNLCSEIMEYYDENNTAVCNLASVCLQRFVKFDEEGKPWYDYEGLYNICRVIIRNLDLVVDKNFYPIPEAKNSNMSLRPVGLGCQGLANVYNMFHYPFGSDEARDLNKKIFETMYFAALTESNQLAKEKGVYSHFEGSPVSKGIFQYDMWGLTEDDLTSPFVGKEKWLALKESVKKYGVRNSLLMTNMPTASTSQICGSCETMEPFTSMMYVRKVLSGEYVVLNENLVKDLEKIGLWTDEIKEEILYDQGSIQNIVEIPTSLKEVYKTAFEVKQKDIIQQAAERGPFICQSQSLNLFFSTPDFVKLNSAHFLSWKLGAKTSSYYIRSMPSSSAQSFGLSSERIVEIKAKREASTNEESYEVCVRKWDPERKKYYVCDTCSG
jgi:ribonucleoside-diphosphate reductase alpha chain